MRVGTVAKNVGFLVTATGVARVLLFIKLAGGTVDFVTVQSLGSAQTLVGVDADVSLLEKPGANFAAEQLVIKLERADLLALQIVNGKINHGYAFGSESAISFELSAFSYQPEPDSVWLIADD